MPIEKGEGIVDGNYNCTTTTMTTNDNNERTPLLQSVNPNSNGTTTTTFRIRLFDFLEGKNDAGRVYETFMIVLIVLNVICFILSTLFDEQYNGGVVWAARHTGICNDTCDAILFGNYRDNGLEWLHIGTSTSVLELGTVVIFTVDYLLRLGTCDLIDPVKYSGWSGRMRWVPTFFSIVDLISIVPFYIDAFLVQQQDLTGTAFVRMFRLLRIMKVEGRYDTALTMVDDVYQTQKSILLTATFVGITTWIAVSALYYLVERNNINFIYCPSCPDVEKDTYCTIDAWGFVNCTGDPCVDSTLGRMYPCYNLYESIPMASYYSLLNLFGEFPHITDHSAGGKIVATVTAIVAVAVFALPVGIIGTGFETVIERKRQDQRKILRLKAQLKKKRLQQQQLTATETTSDNDLLLTTTTNDNGDDDDDDEDHEDELMNLREKDAVLTPNFYPAEQTWKSQLYTLFLSQTAYGSTTLDHGINFLIIITAIAFMIETTNVFHTTLSSNVLDIIEFLAVVIFTLEYMTRLYSCTVDPKYARPGGRIKYMMTFLAIVDLLSFLPYWIQKMVLILTQQLSSSSSNHSWLFMGNAANDTVSLFVSSLRLLRILRFERYTHAFTTFDDVFRMNIDVLAVTAFTAILFWVFFAAILYVTERDSPNDEIQTNYNTIPNAMWMTLLNLSGEAPLSEYSWIGKIVTGILGVFATGIFGIPIGVLGAGFEEIVGRENKDDAEELRRAASSSEEDANADTSNNRSSSSSSTTNNTNTNQSIERAAYNFVNGLGSSAAQQFELTIYGLIFLAVAVGCWQTVEGQQNAFSEIEWFAVIVFTIEYIIRLVGVGADPLFAPSPMNRLNWFTCRLRFMISFYSIIDLLAIVPFYLTVALPNSIVNDYDEYLRMLRIIRLVKLDKYVPSITLVDDVMRLKFAPLRVAFYAATTLWILFAAALYLCEHDDTDNGLDPVPKYGCVENCTMSDRFQNFFDSMFYTGIHLTGDYPITTYTWPARFVCFFMVITAVGVVTIPSSLIANGFVEIVKTRNRSPTPSNAIGKQQAGDDWYEIQYRSLEGTEPAPSRFGPTIDRWQIAVNEFLNGKLTASGHTEWTTFSKGSRIFIFFVIIANVFAVLLESIPKIDEAVGNRAGNFFDVFEFVSVMVFATEYSMRLFCAPKNREALYSTFVYASTFFGIVDFLSTAPWFIEQALLAANIINADGDYTKIFRIFRIFRILQLEDFLVAFSKLDNVFRASKDVLKATGLLALIIWVGCGALFLIFEENNPNWRQCKGEIPPYSDDPIMPGCFDFKTTAECNKFYPGMCEQSAFTDMPNTLYYTAVFLGGEWGVVDFTWPGRMVALFLCVIGIGLYAIPIGTLFNSFGAVLGMGGDDDDDEDEEEDEQGKEKEE